MVGLRTLTVALVGNPNTGKTTLFNALAGMNQRVGNYPGVTVETKKGKLRHDNLTFDVIDLPGTYSLAPRSPDEMLAVDVILGNTANEPRPDVVVTIVDASNLERNLYLMTQVLELGVPVIIALNMMDVADGQGLKIDVDKLQEGQRARIECLLGDDLVLQRLMEMGVLENEEIEVIGFAPLGDPMEIRLRDYRLSLRRNEAARIRVTLLP